MTIHLTLIGTSPLGTPVIGSRHDGTAIPICAQAAGSRHLPVPAPGRTRNRGDG
jgi:hypothetical protein